ncbi:MAG: TIGR02206 family membrane protein [Candidatus Izimaplasma sp.]|nr:TIGR02206 family membrane protein [Candidatus Izimaplasma bacterium]
MSFNKFFGHDIDPEKAVNLLNIHHFFYMVFGMFTIYSILKFSDKIKESDKENLIKKILVLVFIILEITYHIHNWTYPRLSLPLHICSFAVLLNITLLLTNKKSVFEYAFFYGILGGGMALLVPFSIGYTYLNFRYYHYFILHSLIIAVPLYYYVAYNYRVTYTVLLRIFRESMILAVGILILDNFLNFAGYNANYWFIAYIPKDINSIFSNYFLYILVFVSTVFITMNLLFFITHPSKIKEKIHL